MAARVSKNAREGGRSKVAKHLCGKGHEQTRVKRVPVVGRERMLWLCECDGWAPIADQRNKPGKA
jgi:hypothetical protein